MLRLAGRYSEVASGKCGCDDEGPGFDAIGDYAMACTAELCDAAHADGAGASSIDLCAHFREQCSKVDHFGLAGTVLEDGFAVGESGGHQQVFRSGDCDFFEDETAAFQALGGRLDVPVLLGNTSAEFFQALDVQINGARADGAAAGKRNTCLT